MNRWFNLENPVFQVIARIADLIMLGLICLVCCVPVVTIGPAMSALFKAVYDLTLERGSGAVKNYSRAFRDNWKQAMGGWLLALLLAGLLCYLFPLIARYSNTFWEHVRNAFILEIRYFHKTLLMVLIQMLPLLMFTLMPFVLIYTLLFWILLFPGFSMQANAYLIRPIFEKLEEQEEEDGQEEDGEDES